MRGSERAVALYKRPAYRVIAALLVLLAGIAYYAYSADMMEAGL